MTRKSVVAAAMTAAALFGAAGVQAQTKEGHALSLSAGVFDLGGDDHSAEFKLEWRGSDDWKLWILRPLAGLMATSEGARYGYAGIALDLRLGGLVLTPSIASGLYAPGNDIDLGHRVEFRSQLEVAWRFDSGQRVGAYVAHMSNAGLGDRNPGTESIGLAYTVPFAALLP